MPQKKTKRKGLFYTHIYIQKQSNATIEHTRPKRTIAQFMQLPTQHDILLLQQYTTTLQQQQRLVPLAITFQQILYLNISTHT